jgi:phosphocarrier protein HPr
MLEHQITISDPQGLHAQASAKLVQVLSPFQSKVELHANGRIVNAKSIMGVMLLAAGPGTQITVIIDGPDEADALAAIKTVF